MAKDRVYSCYRAAHKLYKWHLTPLSFLIRAFMRFVFACDVPYKATIGKGALFPHDALGVVIHPDVVIGENCHINQNVTIGGRQRQDVDIEVLPKIGNNVTIGVSAVVLGDITVGDNAVIGAGSVVLHDVPANAIVAGVPAKVIRIREDKINTEE